MKDRKSSRLSGFYNRSLDERLQVVGEWAGLSESDLDVLRIGLSAEQADHMIENALGTFALPLGVGVNFLVNGRDTLVPMAVEEPSVVAAISNAARLARPSGGFVAGSSEPVMIGQVQLMEVPDPAAARASVLAAAAELAEPDRTHSIRRLSPGAADFAGSRCGCYPTPRPARCWWCICCWTAAMPWAPTRSTPRPRQRRRCLRCSPVDGLRCGSSAT